MEANEGSTSSGSVSASTGLAVKKVEEQLIAAIAACEDDIRQGVEDLARLKEALRLLRRQKPVSQFTKQTPQLGEPARPPRPRKSRGRIYKEREGSAASIIRSFVRRELTETGHPLTRSEILERLDRASIKIDAKVPVKRIAKVMWSSPEFVSVGDGYWFAGEPIPDSPT
ncbi:MULTISPECIES: hypothetical protein [unclassified Mesorhizobium]|uniref:hypothetical protein n=1 Tax=unclassified Mesorhizobium TaxID=325217 RepID=UPI00112B06C5|nr:MULTISPECIES: hypothetical protein [unclassified Mesorhizobium]MBZ9696463.1 hypothetical protein [Mesorhizobium sp. CO1-1-9]TPK11623.1 hypothetical protein FJ543_19745 [Mesorhizobium sp. B2-5-7]